MKRGVVVKALADLGHLLGLDLTRRKKLSPASEKEAIFAPAKSPVAIGKPNRGVKKVLRQTTKRVQPTLKRGPPPLKKKHGPPVQAPTDQACPLCKVQVGKLNEHYQQFHPVEWRHLKEMERDMLKRSTARPVIFLGGGPGSGKRR